MENHITPAAIRDGATRAHMRLSEFLAKADVAPSTFYRWESGGNELHPVNRQKLIDAINQMEVTKCSTTS